MTVVSCSFLQIYNEHVYDLLNFSEAKKELRIRWNKKDQFAVENLFVYECPTYQHVMHKFHLGLRNRVVAAHNLNHQSSRSHSIFTIHVDSIDPKNGVSKAQRAFALTVGSP